MVLFCLCSDCWEALQLFHWMLPLSQKMLWQAWLYILIVLPEIVSFHDDSSCSQYPIGIPSECDPGNLQLVILRWATFSKVFSKYCGWSFVLLQYRSQEAILSHMAAFRTSLGWFSGEAVSRNISKELVSGCRDTTSATFQSEKLLLLLQGSPIESEWELSSTLILYMISSVAVGWEQLCTG